MIAAAAAPAWHKYARTVPTSTAAVARPERGPDGTPSSLPPHPREHGSPHAAGAVCSQGKADGHPAGPLPQCACLALDADAPDKGSCVHPEPRASTRPRRRFLAHAYPSLQNRRVHAPTSRPHRSPQGPLPHGAARARPTRGLTAPSIPKACQQQAAGRATPLAVA